MQMFQQATIPIQNEKTFADVKQAIEAAFGPSQVEQFLRKVSGAKLGVRQFEQVLSRGFLGRQTPQNYAALGASDQGQIREYYLRKVEQVAPELRQKYFRVYTSY